MKRAMGLVLAVALVSGTASAQEEDTTKWNVWADGRLAGVTDSVARQNGFGVYATMGADTKLSPWLSLGLGVGYENFQSQSTTVPGVRTVENGASLQPYGTVRLTPNLYLIGFGSVTKLWYSTVLSPGVTGQFDAWRWLAGASLSGIWHADAWRLQPTLTVFYGAENQPGYTTNVGSSVAAQQIPYGRISLGPEIGYAFTGPDKSWALEPFLMAKGNFDYVTSNSVIFTGASFTSASHGQWSAGLGGGLALNTRQGFFARLQASYESLGQSGFDVWLGEVRGGWRF